MPAIAVRRIAEAVRRHDDIGGRPRWWLRCVGLCQLTGKVLPMALRGAWYRLWLRRSTGLLLVGRHVSLRNPRQITAGRNLIIEDYSEIQGLSTEGVSFGDGVTIGRGAVIRPSGYYSRPLGVGLRVGDNSNIGQHCFIGCSGGIRIGRDVLMSPRVSLVAENHVFTDLARPMKDQGVRSWRRAPW